MSILGMNRETSLQRLKDRKVPWDLVVIGGGATGVSVALDAATRGLSVVLAEQSDFGKGTSSRSTKLVHGGVRYLRQGNITLVRDALRERTLLRKNAPQVVHDLQFLVPCHNLWERFFYGIGMKVYDLLATGNSFGRSHGVSLDESVRLVPALSRKIARGGVVYHDGQFDDARLLIDMATTASDHGACLVNYMAVTAMQHSDDGRLAGVTAMDRETNETYRVDARCVVNAAGPFCDSVRLLDDPSSEAMVSASQGVHLVLPKRFFPGETALMVPKTSDGRVIFIIPWHDHVLVGTTDTPIDQATLDPRATPEEIDFLLKTAAIYLNETPAIGDILSVFTGIRPLVKGDPSARTASLSRDHVIRVSGSGLVTITGGKWTTVRKMAEDCVDRVIVEAHLAASRSKTADLKIRSRIEKEEARESLHESFQMSEYDVEYSVRYEMARNVEDVLSRRFRVLILNARVAIEVAPRVAQLMAKQLGRDNHWIDSQIASFNTLAQSYLP
ncbi:MAG: glycerol-3-phosphate dehydrogenase/oxidase [Pirellula sp.]|nr:glycerol-3-phosphate dehydrogenase/oxidase [Pirellula sp.]